MQMKRDDGDEAMRRTKTSSERSNTGRRYNEARGTRRQSLSTLE